MFGCFYFAQPYFAAAMALVVPIPPEPPVVTPIVCCINEFSYTIGTASVSETTYRIGRSSNVSEHQAIGTPGRRCR